MPLESGTLCSNKYHQNHRNLKFQAGDCMFGTVLISACTLMHIYVFWRVATVPMVHRFVSGKYLILVGVILWGIFYFDRVLSWQVWTAHETLASG